MRARITDVRTWRESVPLSRPYVIATTRFDSVDLLFVRLQDEQGRVGLGSASPAEFVTGETLDQCEAVLRSTSLSEFLQEPHGWFGALCDELANECGDSPGARAAVDMALYDLHARALGISVVDLLGRCHDALPTSITIGILGVEETLEESREYFGRGFTYLKVKVGLDYELDIERLRRLREEFGSKIHLRVDANQGYDVAQTLALESIVDELDLEFVEQPLPATQPEDTLALPASLREKLAADESLQSPEDAVRLLASPPRVFNIKFMKCGGITAAKRIAAIAEASGRDVMWGCMDESCISIAATLHAAYSSPATRYLDLDGSFDLARDPARGGYLVRDGALHLIDGVGLGVELVD